MKPRLWLAGVMALALAAALPAWAQEKDKDPGDTEVQIEKKDVPAAVLAAFARAFPKAAVKGYSREVENGQTKYEVECTEGAVHRDVTFSPDGTLLMVEESVEMKDVPTAVRAALEKKYPQAKVELAEKLIDGKDRSKVEYEFHLMVDGKEVEVKFDARGNLLPA